MSTQVELFSLQQAIIWCMDNCQMGQQLLYLRAKTSSNFVLGTSQLAIKVIEYINTSYNTMSVDELSYDGDQPIPLPDGMPAYEDLIDLSADRFHLALLGHEEFPSAPTPDMSNCI